MKKLLDKKSKKLMEEIKMLLKSIDDKQDLDERKNKFKDFKKKWKLITGKPFTTKELKNRSDEIEKEFNDLKKEWGDLLDEKEKSQEQIKKWHEKTIKKMLNEPPKKLKGFKELMSPEEHALFEKLHEFELIEWKKRKKKATTKKKAAKK